MSTEDFESAMSENRPQVLICSVEFLTSKKVGLGAFPIVNGHLSLRVSGREKAQLQRYCMQKLLLVQFSLMSEQFQLARQKDPSTKWFVICSPPASVSGSPSTVHSRLTTLQVSFN